MSEQHSTELETALTAVERHEKAMGDFVALAMGVAFTAGTIAPSALAPSTQELRTLFYRVQSTRQALQSALSQLGPEDRAIYSERARVREGQTAYYELVAARLAVTIRAILPSPTSSRPTATDSADSKPEPST